MKIEMWDIAKVKPYDKNPRRNDKAIQAVADSIREFGFRQPIVVDSAGVIVVGHTRWKAAVKLGLKTVPVHVAADLTPQQARAYCLADKAWHTRVFKIYWRWKSRRKPGRPPINGAAVTR